MLLVTFLKVISCFFLAKRILLFLENLSFPRVTHKFILVELNHRIANSQIQYDTCFCK